MLSSITINLPENLIAWLKERSKRDFDSLSRTIAKILIEKHEQEKKH